MKDKKTLLDAMANIDDAFIEEAAHPEMILKAHRRAKRLRMMSSRRIGTLAACFVVAVGLMFAVPYLSEVGALKEENSDDEMEAALSAALERQQAEMDSQQSALEEASSSLKAEQSIMAEQSIKAQQAAVAESIPKEQGAVAESIKKEQESIAASIKNEQDSIKKDSERLAESIKDSISSGSTVTSTPDTTAPPAKELYPIGDMIYVFGDGILYDVFSATDGVEVTDLVIPETVNGEPVVKIHSDLWRSCTSLKTVTIPASVTQFGDVSSLSKSVIVYCYRDTIVYDYFRIVGYTVQEIQP